MVKVVCKTQNLGFFEMKYNDNSMLLVSETWLTMITIWAWEAAPKMWLPGGQAFRNQISIGYKFRLTCWVLFARFNLKSSAVLYSVPGKFSAKPPAPSTGRKVTPAKPIWPLSTCSQRSSTTTLLVTQLLSLWSLSCLPSYIHSRVYSSCSGLFPLHEEQVVLVSCHEPECRDHSVVGVS